MIARDWTVHPGEILQETLDERGMSQSYLAWATGYTQKHINFVCKGRSAITAALALALEAELEVSAEFWMAAQTNHNLDVERRKHSPEDRP